MKLLDQILDLAFKDQTALPEGSRELARLSLFDWMVCGIGGLQEPVSEKVGAYIKSEHAAGVASVFGGYKASAVAAALANGTISHALDYDDTHFAHVDHLSVAILPAAVAAGQQENVSVNDVIDAYLTGAEAAIRIGLVLGSGHYERGFHQTATAGAFGATVAAIRLYGLSTAQAQAALGLCATRASGLKNQFGTMGKPLNAGFAASNAIECAKLAKLGVTSADDGLEGAHGFVETHSGSPEIAGCSDAFLFNDIRYKLHACCHGTHAMLEAIYDAPADHAITAESIESMQVFVHPKWLRVCDIKRPRTGLEVKFSYSWLAGMALHGISSADPGSYVDTLCTSPELQAFANKVTVHPQAGMVDTATRIVFTLNDNEELVVQHDLMTEIDRQSLCRRLRDKASVVAGNKAEALWAGILEANDQTSRGLHEYF